VPGIPASVRTEYALALGAYFTPTAQAGLSILLLRYISIAPGIGFERVSGNTENLGYLREAIPGPAQGLVAFD
jgi:hypothetical protein